MVGKLDKMGKSMGQTQFGDQEEAEDGTDDITRKEMRETNDLLKFRGFGAKNYLNRIAYDIKLNSLYTIHSSSNFNNFDKYSAIILRLGHHMRTVQMKKDKEQPHKVISNSFNMSALLIKWNLCMTTIKGEQERL